MKITRSIFASLAITATVANTGLVFAQQPVLVIMNRDLPVLGTDSISRVNRATEPVSVMIATIDLDSQAINQLFEAGTSAQEAGDYIEAEIIWRRLLQRDPDNVAARVRLGEVLHSQNRLEESIQAYQAAIKLAPNFTVAHVNLGGAFADQGDFEAAAASLRQAIEINPYFMPAYSLLGAILQEQGQLTEAIALTEQAIEIDPHWPVSQVLLGHLRIAQHDFEAATVAFYQVLNLTDMPGPRGSTYEVNP